MKIVVIGLGSWGSALAQVLADNQHDVIMYGLCTQQIDEINQNHQNSKIFPNIDLNKNIKASNNISIVKEADVVVLSIPSIAIKEAIVNIQPYLKDNVYIVNTAKGFHPTTKNRLSSEIRNNLDNIHHDKVVSLLGPSHAEEVVIRQLTLINAVSSCQESAEFIQKLFSNDYFRVYTSTDEIGCELAVALKNVMALCAGVIYGLGYRDNTRAALMTRGINEMRRFVIFFGGRLETLLGLCGIGDLIVTCTSFHSRNFQAGKIIGEQNGIGDFLKTNNKTVEGINACKLVYELAKEYDIEMPIVTQMYQVLFNQQTPSVLVEKLMNRKLKKEMEYSYEF